MSPIIVATIMDIVIEYDPTKRDETLFHRGLDFARAAEVFAGPHTIAQDVRKDYGEDCFVTVGYLDGRVVVVAWTPRGGARRVISMRRANEREQAKFSERLD